MNNQFNPRFNNPPQFKYCDIPPSYYGAQPQGRVVADVYITLKAEDRLTGVSFGLQSPNGGMVSRLGYYEFSAADVRTTEGVHIDAGMDDDAYRDLVTRTCDSFNLNNCININHWCNPETLGHSFIRYMQMVAMGKTGHDMWADATSVSENPSEFAITFTKGIPVITYPDGAICAKVQVVSDGEFEDSDVIALIAAVGNAPLQREQQNYIIDRLFVDRTIDIKDCLRVFMLANAHQSE